MKRIGAGLCSILVVLGSTSALAVPFSSGDFSTIDGWNDASSSGAVIIDGSTATLSTGNGNADLFSASLVQGDDGNFSFPAPISLASDLLSLSFDVRLSDLGADLSEGDFSSFDDYLTVALYDATDMTFDTIFTSGVDFALSTSWATVTLNVSALAGREMALSFDLNDEANGRDTAVELDNVRFVQPDVPPVDVPEPKAGVLMLMAAFAMAWMRKIRRRALTGTAF